MKLVYALALLVAGTLAAAAQSTTPTLVQQLTANLAFQTYHYIADGSVVNYHYYAMQRLTKQLAVAQAAAAAGTPLPPLTMENGQVAPITVVPTGTNPNGSAAGNPSSRGTK